MKTRLATRETSAPFPWNTKRIKDSTYLVRADAPSGRVQPVHFLDDKIASYIVFNEGIRRFGHFIQW